ncbi:hypothetical protein [Acinetobacter bereziniae]
MNNLKQIRAFKTEYTIRAYQTYNKAHAQYVIQNSFLNNAFFKENRTT